MNATPVLNCESTHLYAVERRDGDGWRRVIETDFWAGELLGRFHDPEEWSIYVFATGQRWTWVEHGHFVGHLPAGVHVSGLV